MIQEKRLLVVENALEKQNKNILINHTDFKKARIDICESFEQDVFSKSSEHFELPTGKYKIAFTLPFTLPATLPSNPGLLGSLDIKQNNEIIDAVPVSASVVKNTKNLNKGLFYYTTRSFKVFNKDDIKDKMYFEFKVEANEISQFGIIYFYMATIEIYSV